MEYERVRTHLSHRCSSDDTRTWNIGSLSVFILGLLQKFNLKYGNCAIGNQNLSTTVNIYNILRRHKRVA